MASNSVQQQPLANINGNTPASAQVQKTTPMMNGNGMTTSPVPTPILKPSTSMNGNNSIHQQQQNIHVQFNDQIPSQQNINVPINVVNNSSETMNPAQVPQKGPTGQNVSAPRRGRGVLQQQQPGMRVPMCGSCDTQIRPPPFMQ